MNKEHFDIIFKVVLLFLLFVITGGIWFNNGLTKAQCTWLASIDDQLSSIKELGLNNGR